MKLKALIVENLGVKITSLIFAIILWFFVMSRGRTEISFEAPLEFRNIPQNLELVGETIKSVDVWVEGQESTLRRLKGNEVKTTIDLSDAKEGESTYYIGQERIKAPFNLKVVRVNPTSIKVRLDRVITKTVEVKPTLVGKPAPGFRLKRVEINPPSVRVEGAKREVEFLRFLKTEPIDITGTYESFTYDGKIDTSGKNIRVQDKDALEVKVFIAREEK
jgi:YbbR domain-containing protein